MHLIQLLQDKCSICGGGMDWGMEGDCDQLDWEEISQFQSNNLQKIKIKSSLIKENKTIMEMVH